MNISDLKVLSVDDEPGLVELSKDYLETFHDMQVRTATSAREALQVLADGGFDAIVSDYQMPGMDGIQFLTTLRSAGDRTPFILFTGKGREEVVIQAIDGGADAYVQKGTDIRTAYAELAFKVRSAVIRFRAERAMEDSEARYRTMIDSSPMGLFLMDMNGGCTYSNPRWLEMTGLGQEETRGRGWMEAVHPEDRARVGGLWLECVSRKMPMAIEYRMAGGRHTTWATMHLAPILEKGEVVGFLSTNQDITDRKAAEEAVLEKEKAIAKASVLANIGHWIWKANDKTLVLSEGLNRILGLTSGTPMMHDTFFEMVHPDDRVRVIEVLNKAMSGEAETTIEHRMVRQDGTVITVRDTLEVTLSRGRPNFVMGMVQDITEAESAEGRIRKMESFYQIIIDTMAEGVIVRDREGRITFHNPQVERLIGDVNNYIERSKDGEALNLIAADGSRMRWEDLPAMVVLRTKAPVTGSLFGIRGPQGIRWFSVNARPLITDGRIESVVSTLSEVTEMIETADRERESKLLYQTIVDNMVDIINITDLELKFKYISPSIEKLRGFTVEECMRQSLEEIMVPESAELVRSVLQNEMELEIKGGADPNRTRYLELEEYRKDGSTVWVGNAVRFLRDAQGRPTGFVIQARDITEIRNSIEALHEASSKLALLSRLTRHDIRNQLQIAYGWMELLNVQGEKSQERVRKAIQALANAEQLIEFSSQYEVLGTKTPYLMSVRDEVDRVAASISMPGVRLENCLGQDMVLADPLLHKVIYNLLENSARHGKRASYVRFRSEVEGGDLLIICEDDGVGVPSGSKEMIFQRGVGSNTGDGLFFVRTILSITGMSIVEDGVPGEGARFVIRVPHTNWR
jgi:PAS domain S-box-containing protein